MTLLLWLRDLSYEKLTELLPDRISNNGWFSFMRELNLYGLRAFEILSDDLQNELIKIYSSIID
jgi:hypothetical protein